MLPDPRDRAVLPECDVDRRAGRGRRPGRAGSARRSASRRRAGPIGPSITAKRPAAAAQSVPDLVRRPVRQVDQRAVLTRQQVPRAGRSWRAAELAGAWIERRRGAGRSSTRTDSSATSARARGVPAHEPLDQRNASGGHERVHAGRPGRRRRQREQVATLPSAAAATRAAAAAPRSSTHTTCSPASATVLVWIGSDGTMAGAGIENERAWAAGAAASSTRTARMARTRASCPCRCA